MKKVQHRPPYIYERLCFLDVECRRISDEATPVKVSDGVGAIIHLLVGHVVLALSARPLFCGQVGGHSPAGSGEGLAHKGTGALSWLGSDSEFLLCPLYDFIVLLAWPRVVVSGAVPFVA